MNDMAPCPSCGGAGGGPFGRAGSAWDVDDYVCPRCQGTGLVAVGGASVLAPARPLAKGVVSRPAEAPVETRVEKRGPVSTRPAASTAKRAAGRKK